MLAPILENAQRHSMQAGQASLSDGGMSYDIAPDLTDTIIAAAVSAGST